MRHRNAGFKLGRNTSHRRAVLRNLVTSIVLLDRIETTITKFKASQPLVEKMITLGKRGTVHARRQALSYLMTPESVEHFIAQSRLERCADAEIEDVDILEVDALAGRMFDAVISIPPFGVKVDAGNARLRRLPFGAVRGHGRSEFRAGKRCLQTAWTRRAMPQQTAETSGAWGSTFVVAR